MDEFHRLLLEWESFYLLVGTAGATLAGLMFVAISLTQSTASGARLPILRAHMDPALLAFVLSLLLGALMLMPSLTRGWFGGLLLVAGLLSLVYIGLVLQRLIRVVRVTGGWDASDWLWYAVAPIVSGLLLLTSGALGLLQQAHASLNLTGITMLVLLTMGIRNAWDLVTFSMARMNDPEQASSAPNEPKQP